MRESIGFFYHQSRPKYQALWQYCLYSNFFWLTLSLKPNSMTSTLDIQSHIKINKNNFNSQLLLGIMIKVKSKFVIMYQTCYIGDLKQPSLKNFKISVTKHFQTWLSRNLHSQLNLKLHKQWTTMTNFRTRYIQSYII